MQVHLKDGCRFIEYLTSKGSSQSTALESIPLAVAMGLSTPERHVIGKRFDRSIYAGMGIREVYFRKSCERHLSPDCYKLVLKYPGYASFFIFTDCCRAR